MGNGQWAMGPQWKPFFSMVAISFIRSYSFQWKTIFLVETFPFSGSHYFFGKPLACSRNLSIQWKLFLLMEDISFIGSYSFHWKPFILVEIISLSGSHFGQRKPFLEGNTFVFLGNYCLVETFSFSRCHFFLEESAPFNRNFSFQWKPFFLVFQHYRQQKLSPVT